ncbi:acyl-CoA dehydrogenase family protein [Ottowia thiooxydans]|uniref:Acyl-CoA dehydrogenase n=1 Tax=Ottowia thiooxydans TaxID=219182 RepID=A0ABV2Q9S4_9BURK
MHEDLFADAVDQLLRDHCSPQVVRNIEAGQSAQALWTQLENAGFADAMVAESGGGAAMGLSQVYGVWSLCGSHALPVPLAETMVARGLLSLAGVTPPAGPIALAEGRVMQDGTLTCAVVRSGKVAHTVLVQHQAGWQLLPMSQADSEPAAFCLDTRSHWASAQVSNAPSLELALPDMLDLRTLQACLTAAQLAGGLMQTFERTLNYANDRTQFGRPIGKFQAIQHQLAVMSEHVFAARMAAQLGCAGHGMFPDRLRVAVAKARCSQAALLVAKSSHAIHGAIGFTEEYDLQLMTRRLHAWRQTAGSESYWHAVAGTALVDAHPACTLDLLRATTDVASAC